MYTLELVGKKIDRSGEETTVSGKVHKKLAFVDEHIEDERECVLFEVESGAEEVLRALRDEK